jgi:hypothetical protein
MALTVAYFGSGAESQFGEYARRFTARFGAGESFSSPSPAAGFAGRVLRGRRDEDFLTLSDDPQRRIVFLLDAGAMENMVGLSGGGILRRIGYDGAFIAQLLARNTRFKLALLPLITMRLATWDNLLDLVVEAYPDWREKIAGSRETLKRLDYDRVIASGGTATEVRQFLHDRLNVNRLFAGDGFTRHENEHENERSLPGPGSRYAEYAALNRPLKEFSAYCLIDFPVQSGEPGR